MHTVGRVGAFVALLVLGGTWAVVLCGWCDASPESCGVDAIDAGTSGALSAPGDPEHLADHRTIPADHRSGRPGVAAVVAGGDETADLGTAGVPTVTIPPGLVVLAGVGSLTAGTWLLWRWYRRYRSPLVIKTE